jgi:hypothetical protein
MLTQYLLNRPILEDNAGMITLTPSQYEHLVARLLSLAPGQLET